MPISPEIIELARRLSCTGQSSGSSVDIPLETHRATYFGRIFRLYRYDSETALRETVSNKYFDRSLMQYKAIQRSQVKRVILEKIEQLSQQLTASKDPQYLRETIELSLCAIYGYAKDQCCKKLEELGYTEIPRSYLHQIGVLAQRTGLPGTVKHGIFIPKGAGASPFANQIMAAVRSQFPWHFKNEKQRQEYADYLRMQLIEMIEPFAISAGWCSPRQFAAALAEVALQYEYDPAGDNAVAV